MNSEKQLGQSTKNTSSRQIYLVPELRKKPYVEKLGRALIAVAGKLAANKNVSKPLENMENSKK